MSGECALIHAGHLWIWAIVKCLFTLHLRVLHNFNFVTQLFSIVPFAVLKVPVTANKSVTLWSWVISFHLKKITGYILLCFSLILIPPWRDDLRLVVVPAEWRGSKIWFRCQDWWCHTCRKWVGGHLLFMSWGCLWDQAGSQAGVRWLEEQGGAIGCGYYGRWGLGRGGSCIVWVSHQSQGRQHMASLPAAPGISGGEAGGMDLKSYQESNIKNGDSP